MHEIVAAVVWLAANGLLLRSAWLVSRRWFGGDGLPELLVHVVTLCWGWIVVHAVLLGAAGMLSGWRLLAAVCGSALVALWMLGFGRWPAPGVLRRIFRAAGSQAGSGEPDKEPVASRCERGSASLLAGGAGRAAGSQPGTGEPETRQRPRWSDWSWAVAWGMLAALGAATVVLDGVLVFPKDWDSLAYHIPLVDHWLRERALYVPKCAFWYMPGGSELLGLWLVGPFSGDWLIALSNLPAAVLLAASAVALGRLLGLSRPMGHLAAMAIVTTAPVLRQIVTQENDVAAAALFLAALVYSARYGRGGRMADVMMASVAVGLLAGVKYYALGYVAVAGAGVLAVLLLYGRSRHVGRVVAVGLAGLLVLGGYWYVRNLLVTGTPLFPKGLTSATDLWRQMRPGSALSTLAGSGRAEVWPMLLEAVQAKAGVCHVAALVLLPTSLVWLLGSGLLNRTRRGAEGRLRIWLVLLVALAGLVLVRTPNMVETRLGAMNMLRSQYHPVRFGLCFWTLAVVSLAVVLDDVARGAAGLAKARRGGPRGGSSGLHRRLGACRGMVRVAGYGVYAACAVGVVHQLASQARYPFTLDLVLLAGNVFLGGLLLLLCAGSPLKYERRLGWALALLAAAGFVWANAERSVRWHRDFSRHYDGRFGVELFTWLGKLDPARERLCICDYRYYPFFGSRRQFDVCRPLWLPDRAALLAQLDRNEVTVLVTRNRDPFPQGRYGKVKGWIDEARDCFQPLHEDYKFSVVRVDRARLRAALAHLKSERGAR